MTRIWQFFFYRNKNVYFPWKSRYCDSSCTWFKMIDVHVTKMKLLTDQTRYFDWQQRYLVSLLALIWSFYLYFSIFAFSGSFLSSIAPPAGHRGVLQDVGLFAVRQHSGSNRKLDPDFQRYSRIHTFTSRFLLTGSESTPPRFYIYPPKSETTTKHWEPLWNVRNNPEKSKMLKSGRIKKKPC